MLMLVFMTYNGHTCWQIFGAVIAIKRKWRVAEEWQKAIEKMGRREISKFEL